MVPNKLYVLYPLLSSIISIPYENHRRNFPENFIFGTTTSAYQIEGAWNVSDKGESIWDRTVHTTNKIEDKSTGDIACDSYKHYKRDVKMLVELGVDFYRFSISWTRILPAGYSKRINEDGLAYYNNLINELLANNITPYVTLYHWDLPQRLDEIGGWMNPDIVKIFAEYADVVFRNFGDRVKNWLTFNEPELICIGGYGNLLPPWVNLSGLADYICASNLLKSHARVYHLYDEMYRPSQNGRVSLALSTYWYEPQNSYLYNDVEAAKIKLQFNFGLFAHPIYSKDGDWPSVVKERVKEKSIKQGFAISRLPEFTQDEINFIKGTFDFFGFNHYSTKLVKSVDLTTDSNLVSFDDDVNVITDSDPSWTGTDLDWFFVVPWGFRKALNWIKNNYDNPEIVVLENGHCDLNPVNDNERINYFRLYLNALLDAIDDGCNITGYAVWSLMDNFEWTSGYKTKFGLYHVDFNDTRRSRVPKSSAIYYSNIIKTRSIEKVDFY